MSIRRYIPAGLFVLSLAASAHSQNFKIVVNESNPTDSLARAEASDLFLKKTAQWGNGTETQPVDLKAPSPVREEFTKAVHKRNLSAVQSYWQQQIFSGRGVPPQEVTGDRAVLEWVQGNPGGIGYVSAAAPVADFTVKAITLKE
jgi:ABC-type phosphate transport system substrate-binding protein